MSSSALRTAMLPYPGTQLIIFRMKITVELTDAEVKGIKDYLKEVDGIDKPTKQDIKQFIDGYVNTIHAPAEAVSYYISKYEQNGN